jgi:hypothetical protein
MLHDDERGVFGTFDSSRVQIGGLHAQGDNIEWDQDYDEPQMRDPSVGPPCAYSSPACNGKTYAIKATYASRVSPKPRSWLSPTADRWPPRSTRTSGAGLWSTTNTLRVKSTTARLSCAWTA